MKLWIVAKVMTEDGLQWELEGVFDSRDRAIAGCKSWNYCIWPVNLNEAAPDGQTVHPDAEYPLALTRGAA